MVVRNGVVQVVPGVVFPANGTDRDLFVPV